MFFNHFQMTDNPFAENPPADWLLTDDRFEQALARLDFFSAQGAFALVMGQTGVGKSSLLRLFTRTLPPNRFRRLYVHQTSINPGAFLRMIVAGLGEAPRLGKDRLLMQITDKIQSSESDTLLVIDEAHLLAAQTLTDLRLLVNAGLEKRLPLKIILCGQEPIGDVLKRTAHADLVHRISVRIRLRSLSKAQSDAYMDHRLRCAGAPDKLFDPEAKALIHDYAGGIPRQINNIATGCLIHAASKNDKIINEQIVNDTIADFHL